MPEQVSHTSNSHWHTILDKHFFLLHVNDGDVEGSSAGILYVCSVYLDIFKYLNNNKLYVDINPGCSLFSTLHILIGSYYSDRKSVINYENF